MLRIDIKYFMKEHTDPTGPSLAKKLPNVASVMCCGRLATKIFEVYATGQLMVLSQIDE